MSIDHSMHSKVTHLASPERFTNRLDIKDLLHDRKELIIVHDGQDYHLRITRNNKLILTK